MSKDEPWDAMGKSALSRQVDIVGWAAFFIWIGIAVLGRIGWAWSLFGISAIVLSVQVTNESAKGPGVHAGDG